MKNNVIEDNKKKRNDDSHEKCYNCLKKDILQKIALKLQKISINLNNVYASN